MNRVPVYLIPTPIGDHLSDFSLAGANALGQLEHLFVEADDVCLARLRARGLVGPRHRCHPLTDPAACVEQASALVAAGTAFGILASSGIPGFVDPGHEILDRLLSAHLDQVELIPVGMSSALDAALAMCGRNLQQFMFLGHVPENHRCAPELFALGLPVIYFVRYTGLAEILGRLRELHVPVARLVLFRDIRKRTRSAVTVLAAPVLPEGYVIPADADYVLVLLPPPVPEPERLA